MNSQCVSDQFYASVVPKIKEWAQDEYYQFVFQFPRNHYLERVKMAGFEGKNHVLDAGCGYGQWTEVLAELNEFVTAIDRNEFMLKSVDYIMHQSQRRNFKTECVHLPELGFRNETFDLIWCWSVLTYVHREQTLREFNRVLKKGGRVLFGCVNSHGRILQKALNAIKSSPRNWQVFKACAQTLIKGVGPGLNCTSLAECEELCEHHGFRLIAKGWDGHIDLGGQRRVRSMFPATYLGLDNNIEFIAEKVRDLT
jgi:ubiquinone/menaquinone biosynthesis C-methylase UbiE